MSAPHTRRSFIGTSLAAGVASLAGPLRAAPDGSPAPAVRDAAGLTTYQLGPQIWVRWDNRVVTCYRAHRSQKYPYLHPLSGPLSGLPVTAETALPWPHHRSLFFGCDRVNGGNYWQEDFAQGQILSAGPRLGTATAASVEIVDECEWRKPGGPVVMSDQRRIVVHVPGPQLRFVDWEIRWQAVEKVTIEKTNHSLFALRAAPDLAPEGGGRLVNAEGLSGEKATYGKRSGWCDLSGRRAGLPCAVVEGVALFDHPSNPWAPTPWFTRDYGFMSPTPLYFMDKPLELAPAQTLTLRYRVVVHGGNAAEAGLDAIYRSWAA